ncbi:MAG: ABC transporter permease [Candidatus Aminicenantales bacterium]
MNKKTFVLPEKLSLENLAPLLKLLRQEKKGSRIAMDFKNVKEFDSSGVAFLNYIQIQHEDVVFQNIPDDLEKALARFSSDRTADIQVPARPLSPGKLEVLADKFLKTSEEMKKFFSLLADEIFHTFQYIGKRRGTYPGDILHQFFFMGYRSYPIVCMISFLVGITISLTSAAQLKLFGANIYLADFIGIGMVKELVPLMTGIILAGKIGASIAAEISTMKVMEEVDALKTMGIIPEKFLMVPRLIAISLAVPLLVVLADIVGIFGGILVAKFSLGIPPASFIQEALSVISLGDFFIGIGKTMVFGWAVVISSGFKGFFVQRGAEDVGVATTESVVLSISLIIILDCLFAFVIY